jgi:hypothetical protein
LYSLFAVPYDPASVYLLAISLSSTIRIDYIHSPELKKERKKAPGCEKRFITTRTKTSLAQKKEDIQYLLT